MTGARRRVALGLAAAVLSTLPLTAAELRVVPSASYVGFFGLEVEVGKNCTAPDQVVLTAPPATVGGDVEACLRVVASGVDVDSAVTFTAGDEIALGDGFTVSTGAQFVTTIDRTMATDFANVRDSSPAAEAAYRASFHLLLDELALAAGEEIEHFSGQAADGSDQIRLLLRPDPGAAGHLLVLAAREDSGGWQQSAAGQELFLPPGWNALQLDWVSGDGGGHWLVSVNGAAYAGLTGLTNGGARIDQIRWGAIDGVVGNPPGRLKVDGFSSWR